MMLAAAGDLAPELRRRAQEIEDNRNLPADLAQAMASAGFFRMLAPESVGGLELDPEQFSQVLQTLAQGDASAAWCAMVAGTSALTLAYLPLAEAQAVFSRPQVIMGGVFAPMGRAAVAADHYRVTGRWQWASGSHHCDWLCAGAMVTQNGAIRHLEDGSVDQRMMLFPREQAELIDTWHVAGLKGTGSGDMAVVDIEVPLARAVSLSHDKPVATGALYAFPVFGLLAVGIASVALGNAQASLAAIRALARTRKPGGGRRTLAERGAAQAEFAKAQADYQAAHAFLARALNINWQRAQTAGVLAVDERAQLRLACTHATRSSAQVARIACDLGGGAAVFLSSELQRQSRDAQVACAHVMVAPPTYELAGRLAFGLDTDTSQL